MTLEASLDAFNTRRLALLAELDALDGTALRWRPIPGKWSILEIVEHLVVAERAVFRGLPERTSLTDRERTLRHRFAFTLVMLILRHGIPVRIPSAAMLPQGGRDLAELRRMWDENHAWLATYLAGCDDAGLRRAVLRHPVAGPLTVDQAIRMDRVHLERHIRQIRRLQRLLVSG